MSNTPKTSKFALLSVMLCFFTMGFVDLVGIASNYVQQAFARLLLVPDFLRAYRHADE